MPLQRINEMNQNKKHKRYLELLENFGDSVPDIRKSTDPNNLRWFLRNGAVLHNSHPDFSEAVKLAQDLLD